MRCVLYKISVKYEILKDGVKLEIMVPPIRLVDIKDNPGWINHAKVF